MLCEKNHKNGLSKIMIDSGAKTIAPLSSSHFRRGRSAAIVIAAIRGAIQLGVPRVYVANNQINIDKINPKIMTFFSLILARLASPRAGSTIAKHQIIGAPKAAPETPYCGAIIRVKDIAKK